LAVEDGKIFSFEVLKSIFFFKIKFANFMLKFNSRQKRTIFFYFQEKRKLLLKIRNFTVKIATIADLNSKNHQKYSFHKKEPKRAKSVYIKKIYKMPFFISALK